MKKVLFFFVLFNSYLNCFSQFVWEGEYSLKYDKELKIPRRSAVRIWKSNDSLDTLLWSFNAYQNEKWVWENSGYCIVTDSSRIELFMRGYKDFRPRVQDKVAKKIKKSKLFYIISRNEEVIYIEGKRWKKNEKISLIKM